MVVLAAVALLFAVYYNLVTALVARREDFVLKRLRTGEASDAEIVAGTALPAVAVAWAQTAVGAVAAFALFGMAAPVNALLVVVALGLGTAVFVLLAVVTTTVTRTAEMAQVTTTPAMFVSFTFSGLFLPLDTLPDLLEQVGRLLPLTPVVDLLRLGLTGTTWTAARWASRRRSARRCRQCWCCWPGRSAANGRVGGGFGGNPGDDLPGPGPDR